MIMGSIFEITIEKMSEDAQFMSFYEGKRKKHADDPASLVDLEPTNGYAIFSVAWIKRVRKELNGLPFTKDMIPAMKKAWSKLSSDQKKSYHEQARMQYYYTDYLLNFRKCEPQLL